MFTEQMQTPTILEDYRGTDGNASGPHLARIGGRFLSEGARSRNKRIYEGIHGPLRRAQDAISNGGVLTMFTHHAAGSEDNSALISGRLTKVSADGAYEGLVPNTPAGQTALTLIEGRYLKAVSLRAGGDPEQIFEAIPAASAPAGEEGWVRVKPAWDLAGIDFTTNPGITTASVGVLEAKTGTTLLESFDMSIPPTAKESTVTTEQEAIDAANGLAASLMGITTPPITVSNRNSAVPATPASLTVTESALEQRLAAVLERLEALATPTQEIPATPTAVVAESVPAPAAPAPAAVTESDKLKTLVESLVEARLTEERKRFDDALKVEREANEARIQEMLSARRKTVAGSGAPLESSEELDPIKAADLLIRAAGHMI